MDKQQFVTDLIANMTFTDAKIECKDQSEVFLVDITLPQEESGILIGYRGEKIDALQYLLNVIFNRDAIQYKPVNVDINGYREKRYDSLREMADTAAAKASDSGREILLPPLSPNERRIVHEHLGKITEVSTYSEGEGSSRRVVVRPEVESASS